MSEPNGTDLRQRPEKRIDIYNGKVFGQPRVIQAGLDIRGRAFFTVITGTQDNGNPFRRIDIYESAGSDQISIWDGQKSAYSSDWTKEPAPSQSRYAAGVVDDALIEKNTFTLSDVEVALTALTHSRQLFLPAFTDSTLVWTADEKAKIQAFYERAFGVDVKLSPAIKNVYTIDTSTSAPTAGVNLGAFQRPQIGYICHIGVHNVESFIGYHKGSIYQLDLEFYSRNTLGSDPEPGIGIYGTRDEPSICSVKISVADPDDPNGRITRTIEVNLDQIDVSSRPAEGNKIPVCIRAPWSPDYDASKAKHSPEDHELIMSVMGKQALAIEERFRSDGVISQIPDFNIRAMQEFLNQHFDLSIDLTSPSLGLVRKG